MNLEANLRSIFLIDTTSFYGDYYLRSNEWSQLLSYATRGLVTVLVSETTVQEVVRHFKREVTAADKESITALRDAQQKLGRLASLPSIDVGSLRREIHERASQYDGTLRRALAENSISVRSLPIVSHEVLLAWAMEERQPFKDSGEGYRDSLIWATFLEIASEHSGANSRIAVISNNSSWKDFGDGRVTLGSLFGKISRRLQSVHQQPCFGV